MRKSKKHVIKIYPVDKLTENRLSVFGNHKGRLLGKVNSVHLYPSETALKKQKEAIKTKEKLNDP